MTASKDDPQKPTEKIADNTGEVSELLIEHYQGVVQLTLNRPQRLNSFTASLHSQLYQTLTELRDAPDCRAILLTGSGRAFCTGQDLNDRDPRNQAKKPDLEKTLTEQFNPLIQLIRAIPKPVVCAVNGVAAGAGANLALACDIVMAADSARFIQSFTKVGLIPDAGGSWMLPRLIGEARAKAIAMTGQAVTAQQAVDWGMIWQLSPTEKLLDDARNLASTLAGGPTKGIGATKNAIQQAGVNDFNTHLACEARWQGELGRSHDYAEGVLAFLEKRDATFKGS